MKLALLALCVACSTMIGCFGNDRVVRVVNGHELEGRYIDAEAYDAFLRGTIAEADGDLDVAAAWYARAYEYDPAGVDPLARLGGVLCARNPAQRAQADKVFDRAIELGPGFAISFVRRARCELLRGEPGLAERDARHALTLDADDAEATTTLADALLQAGKGEEAARALDGWVLWSNGSRLAWRAVAELAAKRGDVGRMRTADEHLSNGAPPRKQGQPDNTGDTQEALARIDRALVKGDLAAARAAAVDARLVSSTVAVRACAMARWDDAVHEAGVVLAADPDDPDALAVLLAVPEQSRGPMPSRWREDVRSDRARRLSPLAALVLADALQRRIGPDASEAFLSAYGIIDAAGDPLAAALRRRLHVAP